MKRNFIFLVLLLLIPTLTNCTLTSSQNINAEFLTSTPSSALTAKQTITATPTSTHIPITVITESSSIFLEVLPIGDGGLLSAQPCESPCFFDVQIGKTEFDQIIPTLKAQGLSPCFKNLRSEEWMSVFCGVDEPKITIDINEKTLIVDGIGYTPSVVLSVGEIIAKYGEPDRAEVVQIRDTSNTRLITVLLYWDFLSMQVYLHEAENTEKHTYRIDSATTVDAIIFWEKETYMAYSREESEVWHGYGIYKP